MTMVSLIGRDSEDREIIWDDGREDMASWHILLMQKQAQEKQRIEAEKQRATMYKFYRQFIRGEH